LAAGVDAMVHVIEVIEPSADRAIYEPRYRRFEQACAWLSELYA